MVELFLLSNTCYAPSENSGDSFANKANIKNVPLTLEATLLETALESQANLRCYGRLHDHDIVFSQIKERSTFNNNVLDAKEGKILRFAPFYLKGTVLDGAVYEVTDSFVASLAAQQCQVYRLTRPPFFGADGEKFSELLIVVEGQIVSEDGVRPIGVKEVKVTNRLVPAKLSSDLGELTNIPVALYPLAVAV